MRIKFSKLAAVGLAIVSPLVMLQGQSAVNAQDTDVAPEVTTPEVTTPEVTTFLPYAEPAACTTRIAKVAADAEVVDPEAFMQDMATQGDSDDANDSLAVADCRAVSGTDDSFTKNFNFLASSGTHYFKVITASSPSSVEEADSGFEFDIVGVKVVPFDEEGKPADLKSVEYLYPAENSVSTCYANALEAPDEVSCSFAVEDNEEKILGSLSYSL